MSLSDQVRALEAERDQLAKRVAELEARERGMRPAATCDHRCAHVRLPSGEWLCGRCTSPIATQPPHDPAVDDRLGYGPAGRVPDVLSLVPPEVREAVAAGVEVQTWWVMP